MGAASDSELVAHARDEERIIVTLDADFHALLALSDARVPSAMRIRIQGLRGDDLARLIEQVLPLCEEELRSGALVSIDGRTVRVRRLPLVR